MKKRGLVLALSLLLLAGCSTGDKKESSSKNTEIDVWLTPQWKGVYDGSESGADYDSFLKKAGEMYQEENPDVKVNVQVIPGDERDSKLSVATQTKTLPNIFFDSTFTLTTFAHQGLLETLDDIVDDESKADISETIWDNVTINDNIYFYPFSQNPGTLAYNADMFKDAGLEKYIGDEYEIVDWSTEELKEILSKLKEENKDVAPFGFYAKNNQADTWNLAYLRMFGNDYFDEQGKLIINQTDGVDALTYLKDLNDEKLMTSGPESLVSNDVNTMFQNGQVAVSFSNPMLFNGMKTEMENGSVEKFDARLANIPGKEQPVSFTYVLGSAVFNTGTEKENEIAKDFVKFFSTNEELIQASTNILPLRESVAEKQGEKLPYLDAYMKNSDHIINFSNNTPGYAELRNILYPEIQSVMIGDKTPQEALDSYVEAGNKIIEDGVKKSKILSN